MGPATVLTLNDFAFPVILRAGLTLLAPTGTPIIPRLQPPVPIRQANTPATTKPFLAPTGLPATDCGYRSWESLRYTRNARMRPILFEIPWWNIQVHSYGVMIFFACFAALGMGLWRARRENIHSSVVYELATWLFLGGVVGARGMYVILHPEMIHSVADIFRSWQGGNVFYGCILGGLTGSLLYWWRRPFPLWKMTDVAAPAVAIGAAVGRIGCFLNGCCDGAVCNLPWAVQFPEGSHAWMRQVNAGLIFDDSPWSLPVHPTQLYSALAALFVLAMLLAYFPRRKCPGEVMAWLMILYSITRLPIESLRADEPPVFAGMTPAQLISVGLVISGVAMWCALRAAHARRTDREAALPLHQPLATPEVSASAPSFKAEDDARIATPAPGEAASSNQS